MWLSGRLVASDLPVICQVLWKLLAIRFSLRPSEYGGEGADTSWWSLQSSYGKHYKHDF